MQAVRVLRFSGPREHAHALLAMAAKASLAACELTGRGRETECWIELAIPLTRSAGVDDEQVARSMEHTVERLGAGYRLREYLTEIRPDPAGGTA
ncbi:MAG: hypothetical protein JNK12_01160 [Acidimicrobiales bacterium]|nr:hypothetical protein [Acidimicrobiales bacterium]